MMSTHHFLLMEVPRFENPIVARLGRPEQHERSTNDTASTRAVLHRHRGGSRVLPPALWPVLRPEARDERSGTPQRRRRDVAEGAGGRGASDGPTHHPRDPCGNVMLASGWGPEQGGQ